MKTYFLKSICLGLIPFICLTGCQTVSKATHKVGNMVGLSQEDVPQADKKGIVDVSDSNIVKLLYYSYKIRKKLEITHRLSRSTILYAYV